MDKLLTFLSGKKSVIATILSALNGYLAIKGIYGEPEFAFVTVIIGAVFGVASYQTTKMYTKKNEQNISTSETTGS